MSAEVYDTSVRSCGDFPQTAQERQVGKGVWRMPRLSQAKKDVISCEKLWVDANNPRSADFRMGQPNRLKTCYPYNYGGKRRELKHLSSGRKRK